MLAAIIVVAMIVPGCGEPPSAVTYELTIAVTPADAGTATFTGTSPFEANVVVPVQATADTGFEFHRWTATAGYFDDQFSASTNFNMPASAATVTAEFREVRTEGFWLDTVTIEKEPDRPRGIERLQAGDFDMYAHSLTDATLFAIVDGDDDLWYKSSIGSFNTFRINPYGPEFDDGMVNPFHLFDFPDGVRTMNEVLHKFIDREYIANDIMGGLAWPSYTSQHTQLSDYARYYDDTYIDAASSIETLEGIYDYDEVTGHDWLANTMAAIDALAPGTITGDAATGWLYDGAPIDMLVAIRSDDPIREQIGEYLVTQLQEMGFEATGFKGDMSATLFGLVNVDAEVTGGGWNVYTGGWVSTVLSRDSGYWFLYFHTSIWSAGIPAYAYLDVDPDFYDAALDLAFLGFSSFDERDSLYEFCLPPHMTFGMFYLVNSRGYSPLSVDVDVAADKAGGIYGSWMWALTAHFRDGAGDPIFGGNMNVAMHDLLTDVWNPVAGSNAVYDMMPIRATGDMGTHPDTRTGLRWAGRITNAEVTLTTGLPAIQTNDWVTLDFEDTITAPSDAWHDWDPVTQTVRTVGDALANPGEPWGLDDASVARYSVAYFPDDIFDHPLHDGSTLSYADFLYGWVIPYERGQTESSIHDPDEIGFLSSTRENTIGIKFTVNPAPGVGLKVETWSQLWEMDAERMVTNMYPNYDQGNGFWHTIALGILGERAGNMAFGETKAQDTPLGWINFLNRDVQQAALLDYLDATIALDSGDYADANVPFYEFIDGEYAAAGLGGFAAEVGPRMDNLRSWVNDMNHLWVGSGPYYLDDYNFALSWVRLAAFEDYPDPIDRWLFLLEDA
jgi:peptide/nickel transport system substrate-binding protein